MTRAIVIAVERHHVVALERLHRRQLFIDRHGGAEVAFRMGIEIFFDGVMGQRFRLVARRFDPDQPLLAQLLEFVLREAGLAQHVGHQAQRRIEVRAGGLKAVHAARHLQSGKGVGQLLARILAGAAHEHLVGKGGHHLLVEQVFLVAPVQLQVHRYRLAAVLLGQQRHFQAADGLDLGAGVDIVLARVEHFRRQHALFGLEVFHHFRHRRRGGDVGALRLVVGDKGAHHAVVALEVARSGGADLFGGHLGQLVAVLEQQAPVAQCDFLRQRHAHLLRIVERFFHAVAVAAAHALHLLRRGRSGGKAFHRLRQRVAHGVERLARLDHGANDFQARRIAGLTEREHFGGLAGGHQRLVQAAGRRVAEDFAHDAQRIGVRVQRRRDFVAEHDDLHIALAAHDETALAVLLRLHRPERRQHALRFRDGAERFGDPRQRLRRVEFAGDEQHRVVGLVVGAVERLQILDAHVLDVAAVADGGAAVAVPVVGHAVHPLEHDRERAVLAALVLVAYHRHFGIEILAGDEGMDHAVGLHVERPLQVLGAGLEHFVVVGAVVRRGAVEVHAPAGELLRDAAVLGRTLEHHVLEQVGHAGLAVVFMA